MRSVIEKAHALNTVFYGAGLPVHATDSEYAELMQIYRDDPQKGIYEAVSERSMFHSEMQIRAAAEEVIETENSEIVDIVRGMSISLDELPLLLQKLKSGQFVPKMEGDE